MILFFTHTEETLESFMGMLPLFGLPLFFLLIGTMLLLLLRKTDHTNYPLKAWKKYSLLGILILLALPSVMGMQLIYALTDISCTKPQAIIPQLESAEFYCSATDWATLTLSLF